MLSDHTKYDELIRLIELIDKTYADIDADNFETIDTLLSSHVSIMQRLETEFAASPLAEHKKILMTASEKNQQLIDLIQKKAKVIKKQLMTNNNRKIITNAYVKNASHEV